MNLNGINVRLPEQPPIVIGAMAVAADSTLRTGAKGGIARVGSTKLNVTSGDTPNDKVLELVAAANNVDLATSSVERFEISNLAISSLPKLQQQFGAFVPALKQQGIEIADGQLYTNVVGSYDGASQTLVLTKPVEVSTPNLTVKMAGTTLLNREKITARVGGKVGMARGITADLSDLAVNSSLFTLNKAEGPLQVNLADSGAITGAGKMNLTADLAKAGAIVRAMTPKDAPPPPAEVQSGQFAATVELKGGVGQASNMVLDGGIKGLTIAANKQSPIQNENITIRAQTAVAADLSSLAADAQIAGSFVDAKITNAKLNLPTDQRKVGTYQMIDSATITATSPDLSKLYAMSQAFTPATSTGPGASVRPGSLRTAADRAASPETIDPLNITRGAATLNASIARGASANQLALKVDQLQIANLAMDRGKYKYGFDPKSPITFALAATLDTAGDELRSIQITQLAGDLRVASLSMPAPITVTDLGTNPKASGQIAATGKLEDLAPLLAVLQGGEPLPYAGAFKLDQKLATAGDTVTLVGGVTLDDFAMKDADTGKWKPVEKQIAIRNDLSADTAKSNAQIKTLTVEMPQSKALSVNIGGGVSDWVKQRKLENVQMQLAYDWSKLWPIALPMLSPTLQEELKDSKLAGAYNETFALKGSYPADKPFNEAVKSLAADGQIRFDTIDAAGLNIEKFTIPISLREGKAAIAYADKPKAERFAPPATVNGGTLNINGFVVDLGSPDDPRLYGPKKQRVIHHVSINPALGDKIGRFINPTLVNAKRAQGFLDVTIDECEALALGEKLQTPESGKARIILSITDLDIANPLGGLMLGKLGGALGMNLGSAEADTFRGEIRDAVITIENGRTTQDLTIMLREDLVAKDPVSGKEITVPKNMPLSFQGDIRLSDLQQKLAVTLPTELVSKFVRMNDKDLKKIFPNGIPIALRGTTTKPEVDLGNIGQQFIEGQLKSRLTDSIGGGGKDDRGAGGLLEDAIKGLGGDKDKKDKKDKEKEQPLGRPKEDKPK